MTEPMTPAAPSPRAWPLIPLLFFLVVFLGSGLYYTSAGTDFAFYQIKAPVVAMAAIVLSMLMARVAGKRVNTSVDRLLAGIGHPNLLLMCLVFLLAGAFASVSDSIGSVDATVQLGLTIIPAEWVLPALFLISAFIATAMGTSMGTIAATAPIAVGFAGATELSVPLALGAVVGGAKVSTKIELLENLVNRLDLLVIGGGMANTFLGAQGADLGKSLSEPDFYDTAKDILAQAEKAGCRVLLPVDGLVAREFAAHAAHEVAALGADTVLAADQMVLDAGPKTVDLVKDAFDGLKTLIWNGPMGAFEIPPFDTATVAAANAAAALTRDGALISVAGGGDTVAALNQAGAAEDFTYISTAGGAFLEWMEGKTLPGVAALDA